MSAIGPISNFGSFTNLGKDPGPSVSRGAATDGTSGFGNAVMKGLDSVAGMEKKADNLVANMAAGLPNSTLSHPDVLAMGEQVSERLRTV